MPLPCPASLLSGAGMVWSLNGQDEKLPQRKSEGQQQFSFPKAKEGCLLQGQPGVGRGEAPQVCFWEGQKAAAVLFETCRHTCPLTSAAKSPCMHKHGKGKKKISCCVCRSHQSPAQAWRCHGMPHVCSKVLSERRVGLLRVVG